VFTTTHPSTDGLLDEHIGRRLANVHVDEQGARDAFDARWSRADMPVQPACHLPVRWASSELRSGAWKSGQVATADLLATVDHAGNSDERLRHAQRLNQRPPDLSIADDCAGAHHCLAFQSVDLTGSRPVNLRAILRATSGLPLTGQLASLPTARD
jgi:hypothetical protein